MPDLPTPHYQLAQAGKLPLRRSPIRFAVGPPDGTTSNSWRVWTSKNDVYLACRDNFREAKVSLHATGRWRMGYTSEAIARNPDLVTVGENRAWDVWDEPPGLVPDVVVAFHLHFLSSELAVRPEQKDARDWEHVLHIEKAPPGSMTTVTLFITSGDLALEVRGRPSFRLAALALRNGRFAQLVAQAEPERNMRDLIDKCALAARQESEARGLSTPSTAYGYFFGHDDGGARFIVGARVNR